MNPLWERAWWSRPYGRYLVTRALLCSVLKPPVARCGRKHRERWFLLRDDRAHHVSPPLAFSASALLLPTLLDNVLGLPSHRTKLLHARQQILGRAHVRGEYDIEDYLLRTELP